MNKEIKILQLSYGNYVSLDDYVKLQTRWDSLREWLKEFKEYEKTEFQTNAEFYINVEEILDKMNELEGGDNEIN